MQVYQLPTITNSSPLFPNHVYNSTNNAKNTITSMTE